MSRSLLAEGGSDDSPLLFAHTQSVGTSQQLELSSTNSPHRGPPSSQSSSVAHRQNQSFERQAPQTEPPVLLRAHASFPTSVNEARLVQRELSHPTFQRTSSIDMTETTMPDAHSKGDRMLPEDDGMRVKRRKIIAIQRMNVTNAEKSRLMHALMTEQFAAASNISRHPEPTESLAGFSRSDRSVNAQLPDSSLPSTRFHSPATSPSSPSERIRATLADKKPTYWQLTPQQPELDQNNSDDHELVDHGDGNETIPILGCAHYKRNVKLQCSTCARWYTCRFCHDEIEDHSLIRPATKNMLCMLCGCAQPASGECRECGEVTAWYYCDVCKLWDNDSSKDIYHCSDCGICRRGKGLGKDYYHCKTCRACISIDIINRHRCIERSTECDCPICGEYMFSSPQTVVFMRCGHSIHRACYDRHIQSSFKCPICSRSLMNMELSFRNLDRAIELQPMPPHFRDTRALINCNDCSIKSSVRYHWLGLKCAHCDSYNTVQLQILGSSTAGDAILENSLATSQNNTAIRTSDLYHSVHSHIAEDLVRGRQAAPWSNRRFAASTSGLVLPSHSETGLRLTRSISNLQFNRQGDTRSGVAHSTVPPISNVASEEDEVDFWGESAFRVRSWRSQDEPEGTDSSDSESYSTDQEDLAVNEGDFSDNEDDRYEILDFPGHR